MLNKKKIFIWIILIYFINIRIVSCEKQNKNKINLKFKIPEGINFIHAAKIATKSVVHIKSTYKAKKKNIKKKILWMIYLKTFLEIKTIHLK